MILPFGFAAEYSGRREVSVLFGDGINDGFAVHETANHARQISKVIGQNSFALKVSSIDAKGGGGPKKMATPATSGLMPT